jgi:isopenicillin-N epimerase
MAAPDWLDDGPWRHWRERWSLPDDVTYLNHGSFGPSPLSVQAARAEWSARLERQPMDFFLRQLEPALEAAIEALAAFVGADADGLAFVENSTYAMNVVAAQVRLEPGDQVLLTDHEYGAVFRLWRNLCREAGAEVVTARLPLPLGGDDEIADRIGEQITDRTRLLVVSHVTSPTAVTLPVETICARAKERRVSVCVDGPHAVAMEPLHLRRLGCDYYTASCHKWLSAPFGSGFLYVAGRQRQAMRPLVRSWGGRQTDRQPSWRDEFGWVGTRDPAAFLPVPEAIRFVEECGLEVFRRRSHALALHAVDRIGRVAGSLEPSPDPNRFGPMVSIPIPHAPEPTGGGFQRDPLQAALWERERIEVPIVHWNGHRFLRVSCHLYNPTEDIDRLAKALTRSLPEFSGPAH